ncbi:hypothetical protein CPB86DRAFT_787563 [Serendipita vermifera]|nr:hypothetical protein CPB86DRAFT_787563 [Serendipita vermifera]
MVRSLHFHLLGGLLPLLSSAFANPVNGGPLEVRQVEYVPSSGLVRRDRLSVEDSGHTPQNTPSLNITTTVPLNNGASSNTSITDHTIIIPHSSFVARPFALGGGDAQNLTAGLFEGWTAGRGTRNEIYGTARYGSGFGKYVKTESGTYQYEPDLNLDMTGRTVWPHGFPPIRWGGWKQNYGGFNLTWDYVSDLISDYPGIIDGIPAMMSNHRDPNSGKSRLQGMIAQKGNQSWVIAADGATMKVLSEVLVLPAEQGGCGMNPTKPSVISMTDCSDWPNNTSSTPCLQSDILLPLRLYWIYPWNVVQYYRGSSVLLANQTYDNLYSHDNNHNGTDYWASSRMNTTGVDMDFLNCLNTTIAASIPIIDPRLVVKVKPKFSSGQIAGIVIGSVAGLVLVLAALWFLRDKIRRAISSAGKAPPPTRVAFPTKTASSEVSSTQHGGGRVAYEPVKTQDH